MIFAVCDDIEDERILTASYLRRYLNEKNITAHIYQFSSGEEFLKCTDIKFDAVFMDIFMNGMDGIETAGQYPDKTCKFIFTTVSPDFSLKAFSVNVAHYLLKPITYEGVVEAICRCFPTSAESDLIYIKQQRLTVPVSQSDIVYIEVFNNTLIIHTPQKEITARMPLKTIYEMLDRSVFMRPQRSFIVNMNYIDKISDDGIVLSTGQKIYIAREQTSDVFKTYETFLFNKVRRERI